MHALYSIINKLAKCCSLVLPWSVSRTWTSSSFHHNQSYIWDIQSMHCLWVVTSVMAQHILHTIWLWTEGNARIENVLFIIRPWKAVCNVLQYCFLQIQLNICYVRLTLMCHFYCVKMLSYMWLIGVAALRPPDGVKILIWSNRPAMFLVAITKSRLCHVFVTCKQWDTRDW